MENKIVFSFDTQRTIEFEKEPFHMKVVHKQETILETEGEGIFVRIGHQILKPVMIVNKSVNKQELLLKISLGDGHSFLTLLVTSTEVGFQLNWHYDGGEKVDFGVRYQLKSSGKWYGGGELSFQQWPLNKAGNEICIQDFTTADPFNNLISPVWLSSKGMGMVFPTYAPMSHYLNHGGDDTFHLEIKGVHGFEQNIIVKDNITQAFYQVASLLGRPAKTPPKTLFTDPIWTTWVEYKMDVTQDGVLKFARQIKEMGYPYSVIEIDDRWQTAYGDTDFDFEKFPDPRKMIEELHVMGFKVTLWVMPFVSSQSIHFHDGEKNHYFVKCHSGNFMGYSEEAETASVKWWQGEGALIDFTNQHAANWFVGNLKEIQMKYGVDGFKFDAGEGNFLKSTVNHGGCSPTAFSDKYVQKVSEHFAYMEVRTGWLAQKEPVFIRQFDKFTQWGLDNGLHSVLTQALTASVIGYPFILPDIIGGNQYGNTCDKELFIRWVQLNALLPSMQYSITPWSFDDETNRICLWYTRLHKILGDVIYEHALAYTQGGLPIISPMNLLYPEDEAVYEMDDQFILCNHILVAPVVNEKQWNRVVYLPHGEWYDPWQKKTYSGGQKIEVATPIQKLPFFINCDTDWDECMKESLYQALDDIIITLGEEINRKVYIKDVDKNDSKV